MRLVPLRACFSSDLQWRRKVPGFVRAFECSETRHPSCVVLLTATRALLAVEDAVVEQLDLQQPFVYQETLAAGAAKFTVGTWTLALNQQSERREFAHFFKSKKV